jgi:8-oxo-dGTP pyrophosphatase MutT (NUDIX family)
MDMEPRPAATVIVARQAESGVEVLMERRAGASRFAPGFVVFPGGLLEPGDEALAMQWFGDETQGLRACAMRELYEETALLLTASGLRLHGGGEKAAEVRFEPPDLSVMVEIARWVAPEFLAVRFDAVFFAVGAPGGLEPSPDGVEIEQAWWARPDDVLTASLSGDAPLMWPTLVTLEELSRCSTVSDVLALRVAQRRPPEPGEETPGVRGAWQRPEGSRSGRQGQT